MTVPALLKPHACLPPHIPAGSALLHAGLLAYACILIVSLAQYAPVQQSDMRNRFQTLLGLAVVMIGTIAMHGGYLIARWLLRLTAWSGALTAVEARERLLMACGCTMIGRALSCVVSCGGRCCGRSRHAALADIDDEATQRARDASESGDGMWQGWRGAGRGSGTGGVLASAIDDRDLRLAFLDRHSEALSRRSSGAAVARLGQASAAPVASAGPGIAAAAPPLSPRYAPLAQAWGASADGITSAEPPIGASGNSCWAAARDGAAVLVAAVEVASAAVCIALVGFVLAGLAIP